MQAYARFLIASLKPLMAACIVAAVVSGVILIDADHWQTLRLGFSFMIISKWVLPYSLLPGGVLMGLMKIFEIAKPRLSLFFYICCLLYFTTLFTGTAFLLFMPVGDLIHSEIGLAALGWGLASAIFPWGVIAMMDRDNAVFIELIWILALSTITMSALKLHDPMIDNGHLFWTAWTQMAAIVVGKALWEHFRKPKVAAA